MTRLFSIFVFLLLSAALAGAQKEAPPPVPPPMPQPGNHAIFRGRSVEIPLSALGRAPKRLKFMIRSQPDAGTLGRIRSTGLKSAVVTYTHDDSAGVGVDTFTYAVQGLDTPVSAPARIQIRISEEPPALEVEPELDFGELLLGESRERKLTLRNTGGGELSGRIVVTPPWKILDGDEYRIPRNGEQVLRVLFAPEEAREYRDNLTFSHDARSTVRLIGRAEAPFAFEPSEEIELVASGSDGLGPRLGTLRVVNRSAEERLMKVRVPEGISAPKNLSLPAGGEGSLEFQSRKDFPGSWEGVLELESGGFHRRIPIRVLANPPALEFEPEAALDFGKVEPGRRYTASLKVTNVGGSSARLSGLVPQGLQLRPSLDSVVVAAGETRIFELALESRRPGGFQEKLAIGVEGLPTHQLEVSGWIGEAPSRAEKVSTSVLAPKEPEERDPEEEDGRQERDTGIGAIGEFTITRPGPRDVEISWQRPDGDIAAYVVEQRFIEVVPGGPPKIHWKERRGIKFIDQGDTSIARIENLAPGQTWYLRVRAVAPNGDRSKPSAPYRLVSNPAPRRWGPLSIVVLLFFGILGFIAHRIRQWRAAASQREMERLDRLEKD